MKILTKKGQASVLVGMMMLTFLLFFAFVINTGMLVNAKINLQNAADMAAYAGAAVQARQLNQISFLNYEMRRQYKKFLFRYYVLGNMAQKSHPKGPENTTRQWKPNGPEGSVDYRVPAVCITFNMHDNFCQVDNLKAIEPPPKSALPDAINDTLREQLIAIDKIRQGSCVAISNLNKQVLAYWLFNTDPNLEKVKPSDKNAQETLSLIRQLISGLGIVPKELFLNKRIMTLKNYVNFPAQKNISKGTADKLSQEGDVAARERAIQAYYSAYYTLGSNTFSNKDEIVMDELLPPGAEGASLLALKPITTSFDTWTVSVPPSEANSDKVADCKPQPEPISVTIPLPVGVSKEPTILTYYAVRLKAKAKVLFSPFGDINLKAYAAAQPFGSRIGPNIDGSAFVRAQTPNGYGKAGEGEGKGVASNIARQVPNLPVTPEDSSNGGWNNNSIIFSAFQTLGNSNNVVDQASMERAYQASMVPNPWERGKYNIPNDLSPDPFMQYFDPKDQIFSFWAPVISPDSKADIKAEIENMLATVGSLQSTQGDPTGTKKVGFGEIKDALSTGLSNYIQKLYSGNGEDGEGIYVARITNPFLTRPNEGAKPISIGGGMLMNGALEVNSSFAGVKDAEYRKKGRTGYSVKFVSFETLINKKGVTSDGRGGTWTNTGLATDSEAQEDLIAILH